MVILRPSHYSQRLHEMPADMLVTAIGSRPYSDWSKFTCAAPFSGKEQSPVYFTQDRSRGWSILSDKAQTEDKGGAFRLNAGVSCILPDKDDENTLYLCNRHGIFKSTDLGRSYRLVYDTSPSQANKPKHFSPPMGWNSYTGYSIAAMEKELLKNIDFLSEKLLPYGYDTVTVDNGWFLSGQGKGITIALDDYGRPESQEYFFPRGLKYTIDYAHNKGVKFGIWLLRGINRRAVEENLPVEGTKYHMQDIVNMKSVCPWAVAPWWNCGVDMTKPGAQEYYDGLIRKYADRGVDFIKFDDIVPNPDEVEAVVKAIDKCGRKIVLSLSPGDHIKVEHSDAYRKANMVRITSDIWDNKGSLETAFKRWEAMQDYTGPESGSFLDINMVCFGRLYVTQNGGRECKFTEDQKRTFMVQRALAASPLMLGGVLYTMDDSSMSLFTHRDILECNQNGVIGRLVHRHDKLDVWKTPEYGRENSGWIGVFNRDRDQELAVTLNTRDLGLNGDCDYALKDLWKQQRLPIADIHVLDVPADGVVFSKYEQTEDSR